MGSDVRCASMRGLIAWGAGRLPEESAGAKVGLPPITGLSGTAADIQGESSRNGSLGESIRLSG